MGSSYWSDDFYNDRVDSRVKTGTPTFKHDADIRSGATATKVHDKLNPFNATRESRDSKEHPESVAIGVIFDETGSMGEIPMELQKKLPQLMGLLLRKNYVKDPQILFGGVGDYQSDRVSLQIGQFESGVEMDDDLTKIYLEGNGGGQDTESYQNVFYFFGKHTSIDCFEKRGKKGYLFVIGDEHPKTVATKEEIAKLIGDKLETDVSVEKCIEMANEKYHVFYHPAQRKSRRRRAPKEALVRALVRPEHVLMLDRPDGVCEAIGLAIGLIEGNVMPDGLATDLKDAGVDKLLAKSVATALDPLAKSTALARTGTGTALPEKKGRSEKTERL